MGTQKSKYFQMRLSEEEEKRIRQKAKPFKSVSHFLRVAADAYDENNSSFSRIEAGKKLGEICSGTFNELRGIGSNLNQAMWYCNSMAKAGVNIENYFTTEAMPIIEKCTNNLEEIKKMLYKLIRDITLNP